MEDLWCVEGDIRYRLKVSNAPRISILPGDTALDSLRKDNPSLTFHKLLLTPGEYFPRMARPEGTMSTTAGRCPDENAETYHSRVRSTGQLAALIEELDRICRVVQPEEQNLQTYGHGIRNVLVLACTEVELHWRNVLQANHYAPKANHFTTKDYVKLLSAMRLDAWVVNLNYYPWLWPCAPFVCWSARDLGPSKSLAWYAAYNKVKHDREGSFREATLRRAIDAVTACFIMLCAQYGHGFAREQGVADQLFFKLLRWPNWAPSERYFPAYAEPAYSPRDYRF